MAFLVLILLHLLGRNNNLHMEVCGIKILTKDTRDDTNQISNIIALVTQIFGAFEFSL